MGAGGGLGGVDGLVGEERPLGERLRVAGEQSGEARAELAAAEGAKAAAVAEVEARLAETGHEQDVLDVEEGWGPAVEMLSEESDRSDRVTERRCSWSMADLDLREDKPTCIVSVASADNAATGHMECAPL